MSILCKLGFHKTKYKDVESDWYGFVVPRGISKIKLKSRKECTRCGRKWRLTEKLRDTTFGMYNVTYIEENKKPTPEVERIPRIRLTGRICAVSWVSSFISALFGLNGVSLFLLILGIYTFCACTYYATMY